MDEPAVAVAAAVVAVAAAGRAAPQGAGAARHARGGGGGAGAEPRSLRRGGSMAESLREEPPGGPESEAELSQRLAHTKARSYGSTASVAAPLAERYVEHRLSAGDTLQGIALKYGVTVRRAPPGRPAGPGSREGGGARLSPGGCRAGSGDGVP